MLERIGAVSLIAGTLLAFFGICWLVLRLVISRRQPPTRNRFKAPLLVLLASLLLTSLPIAANVAFTHLASLGPLNKIVNGERHLTLTGWDKQDYSVIAPHTDTIVLQMANPDVTDETLKYLKDLKELRELDLNNSQVTDAGLAAIAALHKLRDLRLARTKISDEGFREHLLNQQTLMNLDLTGTSVTSKTVREWKAAKPDRKALK